MKYLFRVNRRGGLVSISKQVYTLFVYRLYLNCTLVLVSKYYCPVPLCILFIPEYIMK